MTMINNSKILITGGAGFIGSHLSQSLINFNNKVYCLDDLSSGSMNNINKLNDNINFNFIEHDICKKFDTSIKFDYILNFACPASPVHYQNDPVKTIKTNILGSINMLELAKKNDSIILQASTSEIYGDPTQHPQKEEYWGNVNPIGIRSCYDEGKRAVETLMFDFYRQYKLPIKIIRIFNTYGPNMRIDDGRVVSNFIVQALSGKDITIYGKGTQTRSFCYIDDLIRGIYLMLNKKNFQGPVNLGNPNEFDIKDLAKKILIKTKSSSKIVFRDLPLDDPKQRKPDIGLAMKVLNWQPRVELSEGLKYTINYFKNMINGKI